MKHFITSFLVLCAFVASGATPDYKKFYGIGGIVVSTNPPNGNVIIDGSGISAGATPAYVITNRYSATFTNLGATRLIGSVHIASGLASNGIVYLDGSTNMAVLTLNTSQFAGTDVRSIITGAMTTNNNWFGANTNQGTLRQVGDAEFLGAVKATNGNIQLGGEGFEILLGTEAQSSAMYVNYSTWWSNTWNMPGPYQMNLIDGAFVNIEDGGTINLGVGTGSGTSAVKLQIGTNDYITSLASGGGDAAEIQRYRFYNDNSGNDTNKVMRFWEANTNFLTSINSGTPNGSGASIHWSELTGVPAGFADGSDDGGGGSPGGAQPMFQMNLGGAFIGTTNLIYDNTNSAIGLRIGSSRRPYFAIEIGGTSANSLSNAIAIGVDVGAGITSTNIMTFDGFNNTRYYNFNINSTNIVNLQHMAFTPSESNRVANGTWSNPWSTNFAQHVKARETVEVEGIPGVSAGTVILGATNQTQLAVIRAATIQSASVTNLVGFVEQSVASVVEVDCNQTHQKNMTNRLTANITMVITNGIQGQEINGMISGEVSGGTSRTVQFVPHTGQLAANGFDWSAGKATSITMTVTNGYDLEWNDRIVKVHGTNVHYFQFAYYKN